MKAESFGQRTFAAAELGNALRTQRLVHSADAILHHPHGTRPDKFAHPADLIGQRLARRRRVPKTRRRVQRRDDPRRETRLWSQLSQDLPVTTATDRCVVVADRGADVLEFLDALVAAERSFLIRATHNRRIDLTDGRRSKLLESARTLSGVGQRAVAIAADRGRSARNTVVSVAFAAVSLVMPVQPRGEVRGGPLAVQVVRVWEPNPPAGVEGVDWVLVTDRAIDSATAAWEVVEWYECRWEVEEFHKGLKTGCSVETLQFPSLAALEPTIGLLSVLAVELLRLRDATRDPVQSRRLAWQWVGRLAVRVLSLWRHQTVRMDWSVKEYCWALARLGGHQNRIGDGPPGWQTLWKGQMKLQPMLQLAAVIQDTNSTRQPGQT